MSPEAARANVLLVATLAGIGSFVCVQPLVQFQMNELSELGGAKVASVRLLAGVQSKVCFQIRGRAKPLFAYLALMWLFT